MASQAAIAAKTALTVITLTGTALSVLPRGKDSKNVLSWIAPGATTLDDVKVDFSYRDPTTTRKTTKASLRVFSPKTATDSGTGLISKVGDNIVTMDFTFPENATSTEKQKLLDIALTVFGATEFRAALKDGDVMY
jgi:hypothetical protein